MTKIVLASSSPYRQALLKRLNLTFDTASPQVDESPKAFESPAHMAMRLANAKAQAIALKNESNIVIGSDQVATLDHLTPIGKPGNHDAAVAQLRASSEHCVTFYTAVALMHQGELVSHWLSPYRVHFKSLSDSLIERYLRCEQPYQCAGSFMCEGLGVVLFDRMEGDDPTGLIGLPLIRLADELMALGVDLFNH